MSRSTALHLGALLSLLAPFAWAEEAAKAPLQAVITTADDEQIGAALTGLADGKLTLSTDPPRSLALADIERIEFGKSVAVGGDLVWIGQDNHDLVQVGGAAGGNGIQDLALRAKNLKPLAIKQIAVVCRLPGQLRVWRLDTSQSPHWRLAIARADLAPEADIYLEPPSVDCMGLSFDVTFTYADDATSKMNVSATTRTSDQLKVDRATQPGQAPTKVPSSGLAKAEVFMLDQSRWHGDIVVIGSESLTLRTAWKSEVQIPILRIQGIWFGNVAPAGAQADFDKQLAAPIADDIVFLTAPDKTVAPVQGSVRSLAEGKLNLHVDGADRAARQDRVLGIVFAAHPKIPPATGPFQILALGSGDWIAGQWLSIADDGFEIETAWQARLKVPASQVAEIRFRNGKIAYLSDLEPLSVEEVPYFGRVIHWRRDQGFDDAPAKVKGKQPGRWLAMHSRSVLTYALDEQFDKFKATVGFDDSGRNKGRAVCRVLVDGRELFAQKDFRADADPIALDVPLAGAKQLTLEVDFGEAEDIGDRVIWAEPRLFRTVK